MTTIVLNWSWRSTLSIVTMCLSLLALTSAKISPCSQLGCFGLFVWISTVDFEAKLLLTFFFPLCFFLDWHFYWTFLANGKYAFKKKHDYGNWHTFCVFHVQMFLVEQGAWSQSVEKKNKSYWTNKYKRTLKGKWNL